MTRDGGRWGFTTGACAAAAAAAASWLADGLEAPEAVEIPFPDGSRQALPVAWARRTPEGAVAAVVKDAGDDPDITQGATVQVDLARQAGWSFEAGAGVGIVTRPGLQVPVGQPAINPGPRAMIRAALAERGWTGARVRIAIPGGERLAARTFNPRLGIEGGLSVLGTAGRVRPFSLEAVQATVRCALDVARAAGHATVCLVPGHLGERAARAAFPLAEDQVVEVSNAWGVALDHAAAAGFGALLLAGHPGKLAKLAEGQFDTHSSRSPSALPGVAAALRDLGLPVADTPTVEGLFQSLGDRDRRRLAAVLAGRITAAARSRCGLPCGVLLTTMEAGVYGSALGGTPWA
jgi:cobalt-precorrin-5B (C1)-methyltransferase